MQLTERQTTLEGLFSASIFNTLAKACGYFKHLAIAALLGFSLGTDAYFMALGLLSFFMVFADVFDSLGVPELVHAREASQEAFRRVVGQLFALALSFAVLSAGIVLVFSRLLAQVASGFPVETQQTVGSMLLLLVPYLFAYFVFHHMGAVLRSERQFRQFFFAGSLISITNLFLLCFLLLFVTNSYFVLPLAMSAAQLVATGYLCWIGRQYLQVKWRWDATGKKILHNLVYLSAVYGVGYLYILVDRVFASYLPTKAVSSLTYGFFMASVTGAVLSLDSVLLTPLSESRGDKERLERYTLGIILLTLPVSVFIFSFPAELAALLFGYGKFQAAELQMTALAAKYYAISLPLTFLFALYYRTFQVWGRLRLIAALSAIGVGLNALANYLLVFVLQLGIIGIPLGTSIAYLFLVGSSLLLVFRYGRAPNLRRMTACLAFASAVSVLAAYLLGLLGFHLVITGCLFVILVYGSILILVYTKEPATVRAILERATLR